MKTSFVSLLINQILNHHALLRKLQNKRIFSYYLLCFGKGKTWLLVLGKNSSNFKVWLKWYKRYPPPYDNVTELKNKTINKQTSCRRISLKTKRKPRRHFIKIVWKHNFVMSLIVEIDVRNSGSVCHRSFKTVAIGFQIQLWFTGISLSIGSLHNHNMKILPHSHLIQNWISMCLKRDGCQCNGKWMYKRMLHSMKLKSAVFLIISDLSCYWIFKNRE